MFSFADAILTNNVPAVQQGLGFVDVNGLDEYGFTPLIEAAIVEQTTIAKLLIAHGADVNGQDATGATALQWAAENNNLEFAELLLKQGADPNIYNLSALSPLVMPTLRRQTAMRQLLIQYGADVAYAQDYINTKLLGHMYELVGMATLVDKQRRFVDIDFEGFYLEVTLGLIANALYEFQNHFAARQLQRYAALAQFVSAVIQRAGQLARWQQYRTNLAELRPQIEAILQQEPVLIPVGYEGHAITFIRYGDYWLKCDRREDSRLYDHIVLYRIKNLSELNTQFLYDLVYVKHDDNYINGTIDRLLDLEVITELKINAQISGNCSWANVEASIPALFFLILLQIQPDPQLLAQHKSTALNYFYRWQEWNKTRSLQFCIQRYRESDALRQACLAEMLVAVLFQRLDSNDAKDKLAIDDIMQIILSSPYTYLFKNYLKTYYYESNTEDGKRFATLLKQYGYLK